MLALVVCLEIWGPNQGGTRYLEMALYVLGPVVVGIETVGLVLLGVLLWIIPFSLALLVLHLILSPNKRPH